jgi:hypothetical protein
MVINGLLEVLEYPAVRQESFILYKNNKYPDKISLQKILYNTNESNK